MTTASDRYGTREDAAARVAVCEWVGGAGTALASSVAFARANARRGFGGGARGNGSPGYGLSRSAGRGGW